MNCRNPCQKLRTIEEDLEATWDFISNNISLESADSFRLYSWKCSFCSYSWSESLYTRKLYLSRRGLKRLHPSSVDAKSTLAVADPELVKEIHPIKSAQLVDGNFDHKLQEKIWWLGSCGHEWLATPYNRSIKGQGCPKCKALRIGESRKRNILESRGSLSENFPNLSKFWHPSKNGEVSPDEVSPFTNQKFWWSCPEGHEKFAGVYTAKGDRYSCRRCSMKRVSKEANAKRVAESGSISITHPELAKELHPHKNSKPASEIYALSESLLWWLGPCGHEWQARVSKRAKGSGCPHKLCAGARIREKKKVQASVPLSDVIDERLSRELKVVEPYRIIVRSKTGLLWVCELGHEWLETLSNREKGYGCPFCSNRRLLSGFNDFATLEPELLKLWDYNLNRISPTQINHYYSKEVYWVCQDGHSFTMTPADLIAGKRCPNCPKTYGKLEKDLRTVLESRFPDLTFIKTRTVIPPKELDIFIPELNRAIEFNGDYWHSDDFLLSTSGVTAAEHHKQKLLACSEMGVQLAFVWERDFKNKTEEVLEALDSFIKSGESASIISQLC